MPLATGLRIVLIAGAGVSLGDESACEQKGLAYVTTHTVGTATARTDLTLKFRVMAELASKSDTLVPLQLQLRYTRPDGEDVLQVLTVQPPVCSNRDEAESNINGTPIALSGIHSAARLAQQGEYRAARVELISTCRLLQRAMRTLAIRSLTYPSLCRQKSLMASCVSASPRTKSLALKAAASVGAMTMQAAPCTK